jgi:hypothetical protein
MGKIKISRKRQRSLLKSKKLDLDKIPGLTRTQPLKELTDPKKTALAILECLQNNDPEGAMEMIVIYTQMNSRIGFWLRRHPHL